MPAARISPTHVPMSRSSAAPQRAAAIGALVQDQDGGRDRPVRMADVQQHGGRACQGRGDRDADHDVPDVEPGRRARRSSTARADGRGHRSSARVDTVAGSAAQLTDPAGGVGGPGDGPSRRRRPSSRRRTARAGRDWRRAAVAAWRRRRRWAESRRARSTPRAGRRGAVPGRRFAGRPDGLDVRGHRGARRRDRHPLRTAPLAQDAGHLHQPRHGAAAEHQRAQLPRRQLGRRDADARRAGQREHVGPRWPDRQRVAQPHRRDRHHRDDRDAEPRAPAPPRNPTVTAAASATETTASCTPRLRYGRSPPKRAVNAPRVAIRPAPTLPTADPTRTGSRCSSPRAPQAATG